MLNADDFIIGGEDPFAPKAQCWMVLHGVTMVLGTAREEWSIGYRMLWPRCGGVRIAGNGVAVR
jgi:hypothetical protein